MKPEGKARARGGKFGFYTPAKTVKAEKQIKQACIAAMTETKIKAFKQKQPLAVQIYAYYPIAKSTPKKNVRKMLADDIMPVTKPDLDNVAKLILDSLNGVAYHDDSQIVTILISKHYAIRPSVHITIGKVGDILEQFKRPRGVSIPGTIEYTPVSIPINFLYKGEKQ